MPWIARRVRPSTAPCTASQTAWAGRSHAPDTPLAPPVTGFVAALVSARVPHQLLALRAGLLVGALALAALKGLLPTGVGRGARLRWASLIALLVTLAAIVGASLRELGRRIADRERER